MDGGRVRGVRGGKHAGSEPVSRGIGLHDVAISVGSPCAGQCVLCLLSFGCVDAIIQARSSRIHFFVYCVVLCVCVPLIRPAEAKTKTLSNRFWIGTRALVSLRVTTQETPLRVQAHTRAVLHPTRLCS